MIFCSDNYTLTQLKKWVDKAKAAKAEEKAIRDDLIAELVFEDGLNKKQRLAEYKKLTTAEKKSQWANKFLAYIDRWQYLPEDSGYIVRMFANPRDEVDGLVSEFSFALYDRIHSDNFQIFDADMDQKILFRGNEIGRDNPFRYNGGLINHGSNDAPRWSSHT